MRALVYSMPLALRMERDVEISLLKGHELARQVLTEHSELRLWQDVYIANAVGLAVAQAEAVGQLRSATFTNDYRRRLTSALEVAEGWKLVPFEVDSSTYGVIALLSVAVDKLDEKEPLGKSETAVLSRRCLKMARFLVEQCPLQGGDPLDLFNDILKKAADADDEAADAKSEPK